MRIRRIRLKKKDLPVTRETIKNQQRRSLLMTKRKKRRSRKLKRPKERLKKLPKLLLLEKSRSGKNC